MELKSNEEEALMWYKAIEEVLFQKIEGLDDIQRVQGAFAIGFVTGKSASICEFAKLYAQADEVLKKRKRRK